MPTRDYVRLRTLMTAQGVNQRDLAVLCGMTETTFSLKMNNKGIFKQSEIQSIVEKLNISEDEIGAYFFTQKVQKV